MQIFRNLVLPKDTDTFVPDSVPSKPAPTTHGILVSIAKQLYATWFWCFFIDMWQTIFTTLIHRSVPEQPSPHQNDQ